MSVEHSRGLDDADRLDVERLLAAAANEDGFWPLSDQLVADLTTPDENDDESHPISVLVPGDDDRLAGYAQASRGSSGWTMQVVVAPAHRSSSAGVVD